MKPVVAGGTIYLATGRGNVYSLNLNGTLRWHTSLSAAVLETPILRGGSLYLSANDGKLYSLDAARGTTRWSADMGQRFKAAFSGNDIYAVNFRGKVSAIDADRGTLRWSRDLDDRFIVRPLVADGRIYLGSLSGALFALDANRGETVFRRSLGGSIRTDIAVSDRTLYVASRRTLYSIGMNGAVQWTHDAGAAIVTSAGVSGGEIFVGLENGTIASINRELKR
jgi:outer membrane protein assembly factor BamB